jgi:LemA protein
MSVTTLVSIGLAALLVFWAVGAYNRLVRLRNVIATAFGQTDAQLKRRHDLISNLVEAAGDHLQLDSSTLEALIAARNQARSASDAVRTGPTRGSAVVALAAAEQVLDGLLGRLFALFDADPSLKADQAIREISEEFTSTENKVAFSRQAYNEAVLDYNHARSQFPALLLARLFGFAPSAALDARQPAAAREAVRIAI